MSSNVFTKRNGPASSFASALPRPGPASPPLASAPCAFSFHFPRLPWGAPRWTSWVFSNPTFFSQLSYSYRRFLTKVRTSCFSRSSWAFRNSHSSWSIWDSIAFFFGQLQFSPAQSWQCLLVPRITLSCRHWTTRPYSKQPTEHLQKIGWLATDPRQHSQRARICLIGNPFNRRQGRFNRWAVRRTGSGSTRSGPHRSG